MSRWSRDPGLVTPQSKDPPPPPSGEPPGLGNPQNAVNPTQPGFRPPAPPCTCHLDTDHTELLCVFSKSSQNLLSHRSQFGEFGVLEGQFTEPSGVAVNAQNDIIVADTNNHRIQIFDKEGRFKFQFGEVSPDFL